MDSDVDFEGLGLGGEEEDHSLGIVYQDGDVDHGNNGGNDDGNDDGSGDESDGGDGSGSDDGNGQQHVQQTHRRGKRANTAKWAAKELFFDFPKFMAQPRPTLPPGQEFHDLLAVFDLYGSL